jgi:hypothetical protein
MIDLEYCIDCKCWHTEKTFRVSINGKVIGSICRTCNLIRIRKHINIISHN